MKFVKGDPRINRKGAGTKQQLVESYYTAHPDASVYRCSKDLNISKDTARKWRPQKGKIESKRKVQGQQLEGQISLWD